MTEKRTTHVTEMTGFVKSMERDPLRRRTPDMDSVPLYLMSDVRTLPTPEGSVGSGASDHLQGGCFLLRRHVSGP